MKRWHVMTALAGIAVLASCSDSPLDTDCCRLLTRVDMTPDVATVVAGDSVQFTAVAYDENNTAVTTDITWQVATSARGNITGTGLFRATSAGTTYVRAIVGALRDSTLVTITAP